MEKLHLNELRNAHTHRERERVEGEREQIYGKHLLNANIYGHKHVLVFSYFGISFALSF